jgi:uncharacterized protein involved in tolerance to divalent cations
MTLCSETLSAVTTTVGTAEDARRLAQAVLVQRLAACVQIEAITSHYRWEGALHEDGEWRLVCKTVPQAVDGPDVRCCRPSTPIPCRNWWCSPCRPAQRTPTGCGRRRRATW